MRVPSGDTAGGCPRTGVTSSGKVSCNRTTGLSSTGWRRRGSRCRRSGTRTAAVSNETRTPPAVVATHRFALEPGRRLWGRCRQPRKARSVIAVLVSSITRTHELRQTEIENLHAIVGRDVHVVRFQIAMHQMLLVRGRQAVRDLHGVLDGLPRG